MTKAEQIDNIEHDIRALEDISDSQRKVGMGHDLAHMSDLAEKRYDLRMLELDSDW